jgi:hypothetical protein
MCGVAVAAFACVLRLLYANALGNVLLMLKQLAVKHHAQQQSRVLRQRCIVRWLHACAHMSSLQVTFIDVLYDVHCISCAHV